MSFCCQMTACWRFNDALGAVSRGESVDDFDDYTYDYFASELPVPIFSKGSKARSIMVRDLLDVRLNYLVPESCEELPVHSM